MDSSSRGDSGTSSKLPAKSKAKAKRKRTLQKRKCTSPNSCKNLLDLHIDVLLIIFSNIKVRKLLPLRLVSSCMKSFIDENILSRVFSIRINPEVTFIQKDSFPYQVNFDKYNFNALNLATIRGESLDYIGAIPTTQMFPNIKHLSISTSFGISVKRMQVAYFLKYWSSTLHTLKLHLGDDLTPMKERNTAKAELWKSVCDLTELKSFKLVILDPSSWIIPPNLPIFSQLEKFTLHYSQPIGMCHIFRYINTYLKELSLDNCTVQNFKAFQTSINNFQQLVKFNLRKRMKFPSDVHSDLYKWIGNKMSVSLEKLSLPIYPSTENYLTNFLSQLSQAHPNLKELTLSPIDYEQLFELSRCNKKPVMKFDSITSIKLYFVDIRLSSDNQHAFQEENTSLIIFLNNVAQVIAATLSDIFPNATKVTIDIECSAWYEGSLSNGNTAIYTFPNVVKTELLQDMPKLVSVKVQVLSWTCAIKPKKSYSDIKRRVVTKQKVPRRERKRKRRSRN